MPTSVALSPHFETLIQDLVKSGRFNNASEVVRAGLRLLEEQQQQHAAQLQQLRSAVAAGIVSGEGRPASEVFSRLEAKYREKLKPKAK